MLRGRCLRRKRRFGTQIDLQPKGFGYHLALGGTLKYEGNLTEAERQLELELSLGPDQQASTLLRTVKAELGAKGSD